MVFIKSENMCDYFNYKLMTRMSEDDRLRQFFLLCFEHKYFIR